MWYPFRIILAIFAFGCSSTIGIPFATGQSRPVDLFLDELEQFQVGTPEYLLHKFKITDALRRGQLKSALEHGIEVKKLAKEHGDPDFIRAAEVDLLSIRGMLEGQSRAPDFDFQFTGLSPTAPPDVVAHVLLSMIEIEIWGKSETDQTAAALGLVKLKGIRNRCSDPDLIRQIDVATAFLSQFRLRKFPREEFEILKSTPDSLRFPDTAIVRYLLGSCRAESSIEEREIALVNASQLARETENRRYLYVCERSLANHYRKLEQSSLDDGAINELRLKQHKHLESAAKAASELESHALLYPCLLIKFSLETKLGDKKHAEETKLALQQLNIASTDVPNVVERVSTGTTERERILNYVPRTSGSSQTSSGGGWLPMGLVATLTLLTMGAGYLVIRHRFATQVVSNSSYTELQNFRAEHIKSVGRLTGRLAHDFNNLLTSVLGNAEVIQMRSPSKQDEFTRDRISGIIESAEKAALLSKDMLALSGNSASQRTLLNLDNLVEEMMPELAEHCHPIPIDFKESSQALFAELDERQIQSVIYSFVLNAIDAIGEVGEIAICTGEESVNDPSEPSIFGVRDQGGEFCFVEVTDNGKGISKREFDRIFDPFYTDSDNKVGLGLSRALGIAIGHNGLIRCYSQPRVKTSFRLLLPIEESQVPTNELKPGSDTPSNPTPPARPSNDAKILVVDDEASLRELCHDILGSAGHDVHAVADGLQALEYIESNLPSISCVLLDCKMPRMSGPELLAILEQRQIEVPIIVLTGFAEESMAVVQGFENVKDIIHKPFRIVDVLKAVTRFVATQ